MYTEQHSLQAQKFCGNFFLDLVIPLQLLGFQSVVDRKPVDLEPMLTQVLSVYAYNTPTEQCHVLRKLSL